MKFDRLLPTFGVAMLAFALPFTAGATVKKEGSWPDVEKKVDLTFEGKPSEGIKRLAEEAGWSLVVSNAVAIDESGGKVRVDVDDQPADAVLEALFVGHDVVAHRRGALITVTPGAGRREASAAPLTSPPSPDPSPSAPAPSPSTEATTAAAVASPPVPAVRGEDRSVLGGSLVIHEGEVVHTVTVAGGSLKVEGTLTGDLVVAGGAAKIKRGGRVVGNATVFGGGLKIESGGRIDGDVGIVGGALTREDGGVVGGRIVDDETSHGTIEISAGEDGVSTNVTERPASAGGSRLGQVAREVGQSMTKMALLFVLGCVLLSLLAPPMEKMRVEIASRPMRSFALGLVGSIVGAIGAALLFIILCVTVIGIPLAIIGVLLASVAIYGAIASTLTTFGAAVAGHRTDNPIVHLLVGCAAFLVVSWIPWLGGAAAFVVTMIAVGALVTTRVGGLLEPRRSLR